MNGLIYVFVKNLNLFSRSPTFALGSRLFPIQSVLSFYAASCHIVLCVLSNYFRLVIMMILDFLVERRITQNIQCDAICNSKWIIQFNFASTLASTNTRHSTNNIPHFNFALKRRNPSAYLHTSKWGPFRSSFRKICLPCFVRRCACRSMNIVKMYTGHKQTFSKYLMELCVCAI